MMCLHYYPEQYQDYLQAFDLVILGKGDAPYRNHEIGIVTTQPFYSNSLNSNEEGCYVQCLNKPGTVNYVEVIGNVRVEKHIIRGLHNMEDGKLTQAVYELIC